VHPQHASAQVLLIDKSQFRAVQLLEGRPVQNVYGQLKDSGSFDFIGRFLLGPGMTSASDPESYERVLIAKNPYVADVETATRLALAHWKSASAVTLGNTPFLGMGRTGIVLSARMPRRAEAGGDDASGSQTRSMVSST
jgi:hypothetical protein